MIDAAPQKPATLALIPGLLPHHAADLRASGLTDETIVANALRSEQDHRKIAGILNRKGWKNGDVLVFPFHSESGVCELERVKPDNPSSRGGRLQKYLSPSGSANRVYFPAGVRESIQSIDQPLIATEGEKKALCSTQYHHPAIGLTGVEGWHGKGTQALLPDLDRLIWQGRTVYIAFDSDAVTNEAVMGAERKLAHVLGKRGAKVLIVRIPPGEDGEKQGLDDFLVAHGASALSALLKKATKPEPPKTDEEKQPATECVFEADAASFVNGTELDGQPRLRFWRDTYWYWSKGRYGETGETELRAEIAKYLNANYFKVSRSTISNVLEQIRAHAIVSSSKDQPRWLAKVAGSEWPLDEVLVAKNGIIHLPSYVERLDNFIAPPTPALFSATAIDYDFRGGDCPEPVEWLRFLNDLWPDDPESIEALQLWFGYLLTPDTSLEKMLVMIGPKRSGKSTIARVLSAMLGKGSVCSPSLGSFSSAFGLWPLVGKSLGIISDARLSGRADAAVIVERLNKIIGEDAVDVDRKFLTPITCTLPIRFMLVSNELPRLSDASGALVGRMVLLQMTRSFYGAEDTRLSARLLDELPGILQWAIEGWCMLRERRALLQPKSVDALVEDMGDLSSPVAAFVRECCRVGEEHRIARGELYKIYASWCEGKGRRHVEDQAGFGRNLRAALPGLKTSHPRIEDGRVRCYQGLTADQSF